MSGFKDHFSGHASRYRTFRPTYPRVLADFLADLVPRRRLAWEAGCGSGQFTRLLSSRFDRVVATDASAEQLAYAAALPNVAYRCTPAEASGLDGAVVDLAVAAQAVHWFDLEAYYGEIRRVCRQRSVVALITYNLLRIDDAIDRVVGNFYERRLAVHWPPERRLVEEGYRSIPFPFDEIEPPSLEIEEEWTLEQTLGYIESWSGVQSLVRSEGSDALEALRRELAESWGEVRTRTIRWPLALRVGRV